MKNIISNNIDKMCPIKTFKVNEHRDEWITNELLEKILDQNRLLSKARKSGKEIDWENPRLSRNIVNLELSNAKKEFLLDEQRNFIKEPNKFWQSISRIVQCKKKKNNNNIILKDENDIDIEINETADYVNNSKQN